MQFETQPYAPLFLHDVCRWSTAARLGISVFKQEQERAIRLSVGGSDVFVSLPTGYGKSACFGSLPVMFDSLRRVPDGTSIVLVISPLKSLMKDQVASFCRKGLKALSHGHLDAH